MKSIFLTLTLIGIVNLSKAQQIIDPKSVTTKTSIGLWTVSLETDNLYLLKKVAGAGDNDFVRKIIPAIGFRAANNLVIGIGIPLGWSPHKGTYYSSGTINQAGVYETSITSKQIGISPFIQQFIGKGKIKPYVGASYRYTYQQLDLSIRDVSVYIKQAGNESELAVFTGLTYFITSRIGIDGKFRYGWQQGNHPFMSFPNRQESSYSSTYTFSGQTASANIGLRLMIGN